MREKTKQYTDAATKIRIIAKCCPTKRIDVEELPSHAPNTGKQL
jgi:hypothetical protein